MLTQRYGLNRGASTEGNLTLAGAIKEASMREENLELSLEKAGGVVGGSHENYL